MCEQARFYWQMIRRHYEHSGPRQACIYALRHWRFWRGATGDGAEYVHIGGKS